MQLQPRYTHIVNPKLKHTYLSFDEEANLIIKSPKVSQRFIEQLLIKKAGWISRSQEKILQKKGKALDFAQDSTLYLYGKAYPLKLTEHSNKKCMLTFEKGIFLLSYNLYDENAFQKQIDRFYKEKAKEALPPLVEAWAKKMELKYNKLSFRKTKRQWGSCSGKNDLSFNTMMMKLPPDVIQYIIVHELAHIQHKHHQKSFWACVSQYLPDYKARIAVLKTFTT